MFKKYSLVDDLQLLICRLHISIVTIICFLIGGLVLSGSSFPGITNIASAASMSHIPMSHVQGACRYEQTNYGYSDLRDGRLDITLYPDTGLIEGRAELWVRLSGRPGKAPFRLHSRANVKSVSIGHKSLHWCREGDLVVVDLPDSIQGQSYVKFFIKWLVKVGIPSRAGQIAPYLIDQGSYLPSSLLWHPRGTANDGARWQMKVKTPVSWKAIGTGIKYEQFFAENGLFHRFRIDEDVDGMALVAGKMQVIKGDFFSGGKLRTLIPYKTGTSSNLRKYSNEFLKIFKFFKRHFGQPCFNQYSLVEIPGGHIGNGHMVNGGRGHMVNGGSKGTGGSVESFRIAAEHSFLVVSSPSPLFKGAFFEFFATEFARCWVGLTGAVSDHLSESLAIYLGLLALRKYDSKEAYLNSLATKSEYFKNASMSLGDRTNVSPQVYDILVRHKAPLLLACLEEAAGGVKPFVNIVSKFLRFHRRNGCGGWIEFMGIYEQITGIDLSNFALLYIDGPGLPSNIDSRLGFTHLINKNDSFGENIQNEIPDVPGLNSFTKENSGDN